ncbi:hypothetical protein RM863_14750 [Streptomyces sp. DSM 41014]|uniref:Uncharacterized protein n=1 Tax=Streptomyces hintoniae TaxID=3075521 RepID=A0ABU2UJN9_9ACTN|nr:hypothetical protein [Streptomyces sp. DSM 41014]MDT0473385.1 hypothetical protein [Streptomyces sp. DSM 41014]
MPSQDIPRVGTLLVDSAERVGVFQGVESGLWYLRPVTGGVEWTVDPQTVRPADADERLRARTARTNARSRGEVL